MSKVMITLSLLAFMISSTFAHARGDSHFLNESYQQTYTAKALGGACSVIDPFTSMLPCNPALLAFPSNHEFGVQLHLGNNVSQLDYVDQFMEDDSNLTLRKDLFEDRRSLHAEAYSEIQYRQSKWSFGVVPYHARVYSNFENHSLPQMELLILREQSLRTQFASYVGRDFHAGVQVRAVKRELIFDHFDVFDAMVDEGRLDSAEQAGFFLEPGLLYERDDDPWRLRWGAMLTDLGYLTNHQEGFEAKPALDLSLGMAPSFQYGTLSAGLNYRLRDDETESKDRWDFATAYKIGIATASLTFSNHHTVIGLLAQYAYLEGGVLLAENSSSEDSYGRRIKDESVQAHLAVRF